MTGCDEVRAMFSNGEGRGGGVLVAGWPYHARKKGTQPGAIFYGFIHHPGKPRLKRSGQFSGSQTGSEREGEED